MLKVKTFFELSQMDMIDIININQICLYEDEVLYFFDDNFIEDQENYYVFAENYKYKFDQRIRQDIYAFFKAVVKLDSITLSHFYYDKKNPKNELYKLRLDGKDLLYPDIGELRTRKVIEFIIDTISFFKKFNKKIIVSTRPWDNDFSILSEAIKLSEFVPNLPDIYPDIYLDKSFEIFFEQLFKFDSNSWREGEFIFYPSSEHLLNNSINSFLDIEESNFLWENYCKLIDFEEREKRLIEARRRELEYLSGEWEAMQAVWQLEEVGSSQI